MITDLWISTHIFDLYPEGNIVKLVIIEIKAPLSTAWLKND